MRDLNKDTPLVKESRKRWKKLKEKKEEEETDEKEKRKSPAPGMIRTHNFMILRCVLSRFATIAAKIFHY